MRGTPHTPKQKPARVGSQPHGPSPPPAPLPHTPTPWHRATPAGPCRPVPASGLHNVCQVNNRSRSPQRGRHLGAGTVHSPDHWGGGRLPRENSPSPCIWEALARQPKARTAAPGCWGGAAPPSDGNGEMIPSGQGKERAEHSGSNNDTILHNRLLKALIFLRGVGPFGLIALRGTGMMLAQERGPGPGSSKPVTSRSNQGRRGTQCLGTETKRGAPSLLAPLRRPQHPGHHSAPTRHVGDPTTPLPAAEHNLPVVVSPRSGVAPHPPVLSPTGPWATPRSALGQP